MSKVAIVTDSTAYIPAELLDRHPIFIVPLQLIWGEQTYQDGVDITPSEFYERLKTTTVMPTTSQPSPAAFKTLYERLLNEGHEILSIHISSKLSGTVDSAQQARDMLAGAPIEVIDSASTSMGLGFPVLKALQAATQGTSLQECKAIAERCRTHTGIYFAVATLEFLHRGGRIGGGAAFLGNLLDLKPLLEVRHGKIEAAERVRTSKKAIERLIDLAEKKIAGRHPLNLSVIYTDGRDDAQILLEQCCQRFGLNGSSSAFCAQVSPVIGVHTGPGTLGISFMAGI